MAIYLIRHGETEGNARRILQHPETPLSERGIAQAERLAGRLAEAGIAAILASDYARAAMTAAALAETTGAPLDHEPLLQERSFGDLRGQAYDDLHARGIAPFAGGYAPPGGESWEVFHERVDAAWSVVERAAARTEGHLAVVTHGLVCHSLVSRVLGGNAGPDAVMTFPNTALSIAEGPPWRLTLVGCAAHLDGLEAREGGAA
jgi:probable phosphoglycerate mutase